MTATTMIAIHPTRSIKAADEATRLARISHVLLATDLEEASTRATDYAIELAGRHRAVLQILAVARSHKDRVGNVPRGSTAATLKADQTTAPRPSETS